MLQWAAIIAPQVSHKNHVLSRLDCNSHLNLNQSWCEIISEPKLSTVEDSYQFGAVISLEQHIKVVETIKSGEYIVS